MWCQSHISNLTDFSKACLLSFCFVVCFRYFLLYNSLQLINYIIYFLYFSWSLDIIIHTNVYCRCLPEVILISQNVTFKISLPMLYHQVRLSKTCYNKIKTGNNKTKTYYMYKKIKTCNSKIEFNTLHSSFRCKCFCLKFGCLFRLMTPIYIYINVFYIKYFNLYYQVQEARNFQ